MHRHTIRWSRVPAAIRLRPANAPASAEPAPARNEPPPPINPVAQAAMSSDVLGLLDALQERVNEHERHRRQTLGELQQVAVELAVAAASHLVFHAIESGSFGVEELVRQAIEQSGLDARPTVALHPKDLDLLRQRLAGQPAPWQTGQLALIADPAVARGGCRLETGQGSGLVSEVASRLSEIRRHWMEELDDAQTERRVAAGDGRSLRRFPDRRETA